MSILDLFWILLFTIAGALGSYFYKLGANRLPKLLKNWPIYAGIFAFLLSNIFFILALRNNNLSIVYAFSGLVYVWTLFIGNFFLGEKITLRKILAILLIAAGIVVINL